METLAPVDLDLAQIRRVVEAEGGCIVWGGSVRLSPADDILIRIERALEIDSEGQLIASVLSKKIAAGATHLVLDAPVGPTAKIRTAETARELSRRLTDVGSFFGLETRVIVSDGTQPVGRGIGPSLEAHDVLAVLQDTPGAPDDLRTRACALAGALLELGGKAEAGHGTFVAARTLNDGIAWAKFQRICEAQGGMRTPPVAELVHEILAERDGLVEEIDNRRIAKVAKLAGAPEVKSAGVVLLARANDRVERGQPLYAVHADSPGELEYALDYVRASPKIFRLSP
jgi:thymidine phosphorylase